MNGFKPQYSSIKGISDKRRLPRLNKIRLGIKKKSQKTGNEYPAETSYFVCPPEVEAIYGDTPKELDVMLPVNQREVVFPQAYKWYGKTRGAKCTGDGETAMRLNEETGKYEEMTCPCKKLESGECSQRGHLLVMLPAVNVGGVYQIDVGSYNSIVDINSGIDYVQAMLGRFAMVPLKLKRIPRETHYEGNKATHYTLHVHLDADIKTLNALKQDTVRILTGPTYALPAPEDVNPEMDNGVVDVVDEEPPPTKEPEQAQETGTFEPKPEYSLKEKTKSGTDTGPNTAQLWKEMKATLSNVSGLTELSDDDTRDLVHSIISRKLHPIESVNDLTQQEINTMAMWGHNAQKPSPAQSEWNKIVDEIMAT